MKTEMTEHFERLKRRWADAGLGLPRASVDPDVDPRMFVGPPDESGNAPWLPIEKTIRHDLAKEDPALPPLHTSLDAYFNSYWFPLIEGAYKGYGITLTGVRPGVELATFLDSVRGYRDAHGGRLDHVPIGVEANGLQVVVDNRTGEVFIEDWERGTFEPLAPSLEALIDGM